MHKRWYSLRWAAVALLPTLAVAAPAAQTAAWRVDGGDVVVVCPLTIGGSFEAKTGAISGTLSASVADPTALDGRLQVDLATLDTGIGLRNTHLRERYLEVQRGDGFSHAVLSNIALEAPATSASGRTGFTATFAVHGVARPVAGSAVLTRGTDGVRVDASFAVRLPDHDIPKPRYLGVGVQDEVQVKVRFTATDPGGRPQE
jgi:polyisoprenoid-binding protein YceI